ncbi:sn-glycerol 3-phosphate transport system permease protein [Ketogulonicigenium robustum]|uniref:sn-glycerol-3-phosphate transport system permease protein UgpE n=1 Tax=Ketogulonicigenium robustum TaxID=92947 RepID=A0A1W6P1J2_9RHOB|nr:ABC transporter permease subunit [Ketogulonicigenium robustum]ARO15261.1 sn-glycerol 3-phosphate transport system permease protein [Ketogulonicigenium robustum]
MVERNPWLTFVCYLILAVGAAIVCVPLYLSFVAGSLDYVRLQQAPFPLLPGDNFWANITEAWQKADFSRLYLNSLIVTLGIVAGKILISLMAAFAITYFRFPFRMTMFWLIFISMMLPIEARIIPTYEAIADVGGPLRDLFAATGLTGLIHTVTGYRLEMAMNWNLINSYPGLILPLIASASATFLFRQFFMTVPDELLEAAKLDNAGPVRFFFDILLPLSRSNVAALAVILFIGNWNQYLWPMLFTTTPDMRTVILGLRSLVPGPDQPPAWNLSMAAAFFVMLPPALVVIFLQRAMTRGVVDGDK